MKRDYSVIVIELRKTIDAYYNRRNQGVQAPELAAQVLALATELAAPTADVSEYNEPDVEDEQFKADCSEIAEKSILAFRGALARGVPADVAVGILPRIVNLTHI